MLIRLVPNDGFQILPVWDSGHNLGRFRVSGATRPDPLQGLTVVPPAKKTDLAPVSV